MDGLRETKEPVFWGRHNDVDDNNVCVCVCVWSKVENNEKQRWKIR